MAPATSLVRRGAKVVGPVLAGLLLKAWNDPRVRETVLEQVKKLGASRGASPTEIRQTLAALREQVDYLTASADDEAERARAAPAEVKALRRRVDSLRTEILEAFVAEQEEDADTGDRRGLLRRKD